MQKRFKPRLLLSGACVCAALFCATSASAQTTATSSPGESPTTGSYMNGASKTGTNMGSNTRSNVGTNTGTNTGESQLVLGSKITGCHVKSQQGEDLGTISNIVVNANTGHIRYAVLSTGSRKVAIPWNALNAAPNGAGTNTSTSSNGQTPHFVLNTSKQKLASAPKFNPNDLSNLSNRTAEEPIFTYYDVIWFPDTLTSEELGSRNNQQSANNSNSSPSTSMSPATSSSSNYGSGSNTTPSPYPSGSPR
ncbi:MAG TPA: PRC-barrel domain-containing protein [Chthoniobacterales bacterium]|jgi:hypothetical protein